MQSYREKIDNCVDWRELRMLLDELAVELDKALASPYMDEDSYRQQVHDLELIIRYGEQKLEKMLS
jgi:hypothetical protein